MANTDLPTTDDALFYIQLPVFQRKLMIVTRSHDQTIPFDVMRRTTILLVNFRRVLLIITRSTCNCRKLRHRVRIRLFTASGRLGIPNSSRRRIRNWRSQKSRRSAEYSIFWVAAAWLPSRFRRSVMSADDVGLGVHCSDILSTHSAKVAYSPKLTLEFSLAKAETYPDTIGSIKTAPEKTCVSHQTSQ